MSYYDKVIKHVEEKYGAVTTKRFSNYGFWSFSEKDKFSPYLVVAFGFQDDYGTFSYYHGKGIGLADGFVNGCGCLPTGCTYQTHWRMHTLDKALELLEAFENAVRQHATVPVGDIYNLGRSS